MSAPTVVPLVDHGLGNSAYLVDLGDGRALVVDGSRDLRSVRVAAANRGLSVAFAADTHLHADFLSGARQLAATDGATVLASAAGQREFAHRGLRGDDEVDLGGLRLRALTTPGHTHEHLSFLLLDEGAPLGVFTGGSLIVGSAARTDLVDPGRTEDLARAQYRSLHSLTNLPDEVAVWPTHGAGSFCSAPPGAERTSTIGREKATNSLLRMPDEDAFVAALVSALGSYPPYFLRLGEVNRRGPALLDTPPALAPLHPDRVGVLVANGAELIDVRPVTDFAFAHLPGSLSIPLRDVFATWLGWLARPDRPIIAVRNSDQDPEEILWQAAKVGFDDLAGELSGGIDAWLAAGQGTSAVPLTSPDRIDGAPILDVRQATEFAAGHVPGAAHVELGDLPAQAKHLPGSPTVVMCGHGERAMTAASLLERAGHTRVTVLIGGPDDWAESHRVGLETSG